MDITALKSQIKSGKFDKWYIFTGPEIQVMRIYLYQMAKVSQRTLKNFDSITSLAQKSYSRSIVNTAFLAVFYEERELLSDEKLQALITQNNTFSEHLLVFVYSNIDKRSKLYKNYKDHIVEFDYLSEDILIRYIQKDINLPEHACRKLIDYCESDYSRILLEIDKILQYSHASGRTVENAFAKLIDDGTIYVPPRDAVFDFVDAVLRNKPNLAFELLEESYASGESTLVLLANLYTGAKSVLQVQAYSGDKKLTEATGLTAFQVKLASGRRNVFSNGDLVFLMQLIREVERGIKIGTIDDALAVSYVLVQFF